MPEMANEPAPLDVPVLGWSLAVLLVPPVLLVLARRPSAHKLEEREVAAQQGHVRGGGAVAVGRATVRGAAAGGLGGGAIARAAATVRAAAAATVRAAAATGAAVVEELIVDALCLARGILGSLGLGAVLWRLMSAPADWGGNTEAKGSILLAGSRPCTWS